MNVFPSTYGGLRAVSIRVLVGLSYPSTVTLELYGCGER